MDDTLLTTDEAAAYLGLAASSIRWAIKRGQLTARRFGTNWAIRRDDLDDYRTRIPARKATGRNGASKGAQ